MHEDRRNGDVQSTGAFCLIRMNVTYATAVTMMDCEAQAHALKDVLPLDVVKGRGTTRV